ncbi:tRNA-splicing endonuclease subunit sen54 N-term-domain-containing protein [Schizophyllum amplum]|uniref:tRNA-splicing endonuclease subunit sen54 N-term-domain-containing protein n=1 Tax=Schizophyllum amplum TaxID=97359 RepID=A0A550C8K0_9AGAR|nr:tRNA-splicing endonuclease subunit sen54 N-term-domain-containing protein [Auriculariopsis ampla]
MDDTFERPTAGALPTTERETAPEDDEQASDDEEGTQDWAKLAQAYSRSAAPAIPKRGEKEFEPVAGGGSGLQKHVLERSRNAMFDILRTTRVIANKSMSYAVWCSDIARAHVLVAHGVHFSNMGHSAPRPYVDDEGMQKVHKRLELLPEETIYLVERGALFCWKDGAPAVAVPGMEEAGAPPMTVQQVYTELIGMEGLTLEKLQVYAYLKRLGYVVTRAHAPDENYPMPTPPKLSSRAAGRGLFGMLGSGISRFLAFLWQRPFDWWNPLSINRWVGRIGGYAHVYRSLRFIPSGHDIQLRPADSEKRERNKQASPYRVFFNIYKPMTAFKKSSPPPPDYQVVVVNARTTLMPSLQEFADMFDLLPELPPPLPRKKNFLPPPGEKPAPGQKINRALPNAPKHARPPQEQKTQPPSSFLERVFPWAFPARPLPGPRINPFMALRAGKRMIIIAAVDSGNISFYRFMQGSFVDWPMN